MRLSMVMVILMVVSKTAALGENILKHVQEEDKRQAILITALLEPFNRVFLHFENSTNHLANSIAVNLSSTSIITFNQDTGKMTRKSIYQRKYYKVYVILLDDPLKIGDYGDVRRLDEMLIVCDVNKNSTCSGFNDDVNQIIADSILKRIYSLVYLKIYSNHAEVYEICYYCGPLSKRYQFVARVEKRKELPDVMQKLSKIDRKRLSNCNGHAIKGTFRTSTLHCEGATNSTVDNITTTTCRKRSGFEAEMIKSLEQEINIKVQLVSGPDDDSMNRFTLATRELNESIAELMLGNALITPERLKFLEATAPIGHQSILLVYYEHRGGFDRLKKCFELTTLIAILVSIIILCLIIYFMTCYGAEKSMLIDIFWNVIQILIEQSSKVAMKMYSRPLIMSWIFSCMILTTCLKAKLTSTNIRPVKQAEHTINELIEKNYTIMVSKNYTDYESLIKTQFPHARVHRILTQYDPCGAAKLLFEEKVLIVTTMATFVEHLIGCPEVNMKHNLKDLGEIPMYTTTASSWMLPGYHPMAEVITRSKLRFMENGIYWHWTNLVTKNKIWQSFKYPKLLRELKEGQVRALRLEDVMAPLIIWVVGMMLASFCFVAELAYYRLSATIRFRRRRHYHIEFTH